MRHMEALEAPTSNRTPPLVKQSDKLWPKKLPHLETRVVAEVKSSRSLPALVRHIFALGKSAKSLTSSLSIPIATRPVQATEQLVELSFKPTVPSTKETAFTIDSGAKNLRNLICENKELRTRKPYDGRVCIIQLKQQSTT